MMFLAASLVLASATSSFAPATPPASAQPELDAFFAPLPSAAATSPAPAPLLGKDGTFSYTYAELNYVWTDIDGVDDSLNGFEGTVSWNLLAGLFLLGTYSNSQGDLDIQTYKIGAGYHIPLGDKFDLVGVLTYEHDEFDFNGLSDNEDGYELGVGGRFMVGEKFELNGQLLFNHVDDDDFGVEVGGRFYFAGHLSAGATVETLDDDFRFAVGARFEF